MERNNLKKAIENIQNNFDDELWKEVDFGSKNLPTYKISNFGRIKSYAYEKYPQGKIINGSLVNGYRALSVRLNNGETVSKYVHKLVAEFFVKKTNKSQTYVIHKDHNKLNNHYENLMWATREELEEHNKKSPNKRGRRPGQKNNDANINIKINKTLKNLSKLRFQLQKVLNEIAQTEKTLKALNDKKH